MKKSVGIRLPVEMAEALAARAKSEGTSISSIVETALVTDQTVVAAKQEFRFQARGYVVSPVYRIVRVTHDRMHNDNVNGKQTVRFIVDAERETTE